MKVLYEDLVAEKDLLKRQTLLDSWKKRFPNSEPLVLMDDECAQVLQLLRDSTVAFPASMRRVGPAGTLLGFLRRIAQT